MDTINEAVALSFSAPYRSIVSSRLVNYAIVTRYSLAGFAASLNLLGKQNRLLQSSPVFPFKSFELPLISLKAID